MDIGRKTLFIMMKCRGENKYIHKNESNVHHFTIGEPLKSVLGGMNKVWKISHKNDTNYCKDCEG